MSIRLNSIIFVAFFIAIVSGVVVKGQSADSALYILNHKPEGDKALKYQLLCDVARYSVNADTIIKYSDLAIAIAEDLKISPVKAIVYKGFGYLNSGELASALECFITAADFFKGEKDKVALATMYNSISEAYNQQENYNNAILYLKSAIELLREEKDTIRLATALTNLGYNNYCMARYDTALILYAETREIYMKMGNLTEYAICLGNSGLVYSRLSEFQKAEEFLLKAIEILSGQDNDRAVTQYMIEYAGILQQKGEIKKGISTARFGIENSKRNNFLEFERDAALRLAKLYEFSGQYDSAYFFQSLYINANDSIKSFRNIQRMADLRTEFEVAKKQTEVEVLEKNKVIQLIVILGLMLILFLAIGLILLYYYSLKRSKKLSAALDERNMLLEEQSLVLKGQREELSQQKEEIISSIKYAKYIQSSILPQGEQLESLLGEYFVLFKPKDIVSGDFYWISNIENKTVITAADCTGHGVPGAFMSMLGTALLNEIVNKEYITHPAVILRRLRKEVIHSLQQKGERGEQKDGMDIGLCTIDLENMKLQFAGAHNPLYLVRKSNLEKVGLLRCDLGGDELLYEIKGDLMPIGISDRMENFTFHEISIYKGDTFYLFSDGFPDQFGGIDNKKFGYRRFREQLLKNNSKSMAENKIILEKVLNEWMGENSQIDDILVIGFRIG